MRIAICDDEKIFFNELNSLLEVYSTARKESILTSHFKFGNDLLASKEKFDLIFMDYQMDGLDGMETARKIRLNDKNITLIFVTSFPQIVFQSFEVNSFRFLTKPIQQEPLFQALDAYLEAIRTDDFFILNTVDDVWKIRLSEIIYVESKLNHSIIRTVDNQLESCRYLREIQKMLPSNLFMRTHRSYITSFLHIRCHDNKTIYFDNNERGLIGKTYLSKFKDAFQDYIIRYNTKR